MWPITGTMPLRRRSAAARDGSLPSLRDADQREFGPASFKRRILPTPWHSDVKHDAKGLAGRAWIICHVNKTWRHVVTIARGGWAILMPDGKHFLTAVNGGGLGGPDSGPGLVALHTDATTPGPWEMFRIIILSGGPEFFSTNTSFALQTVEGNFVTAVDGGGIGGLNNATCPIHTDATNFGEWETYLINVVDKTAPVTVTIQTGNGNYRTAVNGGGVGVPAAAPAHTDATKASTWETFSVVPQIG
jgi:hypothetical protein